MNIEEVLKSVLETYGSFAVPRFEKINSRFQQNMWGELLEELNEAGIMVEKTDLNSDVSRVLEFFENGSHVLTIQLSLVGSYALMFRIFGPASEMFLSETSDCLSELETSIFTLAKKHGMKLLNFDELNYFVKMILFDTPPEKVCLYQVLFSDNEFLPGEFCNNGLL